MSQFHISSLCFLYLVTTRHHALVQRNLKPESAIPQLPWLCMSTIPSAVIGSWTLWSSPSTWYSFAEYLVLDDGRCLNSLLPADFIPSTSDHLLWDRNLESSLSALRLAIISGRFSRHRKFLGNTSMSHDRWILSSVRPQHIYSHLLVSTLVPWFPFSSLEGDLASVNGMH